MKKTYISSKKSDRRYAKATTNQEILIMWETWQKIHCQFNGNFRYRKNLWRPVIRSNKTRPVPALSEHRKFRREGGKGKSVTMARGSVISIHIRDDAILVHLTGLKKTFVLKNFTKDTVQKPKLWKKWAVAIGFEASKSFWCSSEGKFNAYGWIWTTHVAIVQYCVVLFDPEILSYWPLNHIGLWFASEWKHLRFQWVLTR